MAFANHTRLSSEGSPFVEVTDCSFGYGRLMALLSIRYGGFQNKYAWIQQFDMQESQLASIFDVPHIIPSRDYHLVDPSLIIAKKFVIKDILSDSSFFLGLPTYDPLVDWAQAERRAAERGIQSNPKADKRIESKANKKKQQQEQRRKAKMSQQNESQDALSSDKEEQLHSEGESSNCDSE